MTHNTILILDDDRGLRTVVAELVTTMGHRALTAATQEEALQLARSHDLSASILDMFVRGRTGLETLVMLRQIHFTLPAIIMSGNLTDSLRAEVMKTGVSSVLEKPLDLLRLRQAIRMLVN